ncbi:hypothetical protein Mgra_00004315 [Meloidogyne graminicola]|uniref:Uncharacterized protein n=1 Tax=Meloidogyne graminicola TaxID=189291 RepID=A0A8S9ZTL3_9BILA|nr:hypothetical protein Mgra_00004315 [Meloidogyne graminicola]
MCSDLSYKDLPIKMYAELAKMAEKRSDITQTQAIAHSTTTGHSLFPGMEIVSNETFWQLQLNNNELDKILENGMNVLCGTLKSTIYLPGKLGTGDVHYLVKHWEEMNTNDEGKLDKSINLNILTNLLNTGQLGAVTVNLDARPSIISILFFHGNNYSLWDGQSIWVDRISVSPVHFECHFPNSISAMFGKLVELSKAIGSKRINWTFNEESTNNFGQIMENIGAINMTKNENWYIYRSNKQQISEYLNDGDIRYMKLNKDYKKLTNEWLKKTKNN